MLNAKRAVIYEFSAVFQGISFWWVAKKETHSGTSREKVQKDAS